MHMFKVIVSYLVIVVCGSMMVAALADRKELESRREALQLQALQSRKTEHQIESYFVERWSPRAMSAKDIADEDLMCLFEAAKWAPSSYNAQPARFVYAKRNTAHWDKFLNWLVPFNQTWAKNSSALILVLSYKYFPHNREYSATHSFDTGAAWQNFALQACSMGLVAHGMGGFDRDLARAQLGITDDYDIEMMIAVGKPADRSVLPIELQPREEPSTRNPLKTFVFEGEFPKE